MRVDQLSTSSLPSTRSRPSRAAGEALKNAADWLAEYRRLWEESCDRLDEHLREIQKGPIVWKAWTEPGHLVQLWGAGASGWSMPPSG